MAAAFERKYPNRLGVTTRADFNVQFTRSGDEERDVRNLTQEMVSAHEKFIRACPEQWYMFREMWPHRSPTASTT